jgi:Flp pilus assembly secretin CpaC
VSRDPLAFAVLAALAVIAIARPAGAQADGQILSISTGHSLVIHGRGITKIAIGDGKVAAAIPLDSSRIVINPKAPGDTSIFVWEADGQHTYELTVTDTRLDQLARLLRSAIDTSGVTVSAIGSTIFVNGKVADIAEYQRIDGIVTKFQSIKYDSGTVATLVDALTVKKPLGSLQDKMAVTPGSSGLRVDMDPTGNVVLSGRVRDREQEQQVVDSVSGLAGSYLKTDGKVIDRLSLEAKSQVDVKVDILEIDRTAASQLGLRLQTAQQTTLGGSFTVGSSQSITAVENPNRITNSTGNPFLFGPFERVSLLAPTIDLMLQTGHARSLSSPDLVTLPGKLATFLVGGEIPIPVSNGLGTVTIQYEQYGVQLNVTPTINGDGSVETLVTPEISDLDYADGVSLNGFTVPALKTSKVSTDVITQDGESVVIAGLLRRMESRNFNKIPGLGDLPILGALFRSVTYQKTDTDVVFVLTPTIITRHPEDATSTLPVHFVPQAPPVPVPTQSAKPKRRWLF